MAQLLLHGSNIRPPRQQMGGKGMAQGMAGDRFSQLQLTRRGTNRFLQGGWIQMMSTQGPIDRIATQMGCRKQVVPTQLPQQNTFRVWWLVAI